MPDEDQMRAMMEQQIDQASRKQAIYPRQQAIYPRQQAIYPAPLQFSSEQLALDPILHFFHYAHLPAALQTSSRLFCELAGLIINNLPRNAERSVALRNLLEAKDAAVRANVGAAVTFGAAGVASHGGRSFFDRLKTERSELVVRLSALSNFLSGNTLLSVPENQRDMLVQQKQAMTEYLAILNARIENIEHEQKDHSTRMDIDEEPEAREVGGADPVRDGPIKFGD